MSNWNELIFKNSLTRQEEKQIPAALCESYIIVLDYCVKYLAYTEEDILCNLEIKIDEFKNPRNWITITDERQFSKNIYENSKSILSHHDYVTIGIHYLNSFNSVFVLFFKLMSVTRAFEQSAIHVKKFNNEYSITPYIIKPGEVLLQIQDYPFYHNLCMGHECRFTEGAFIANLLLHNIKSYKTDHLICGKKIKQLINNAYGHLNISYEEDENFIYLNNAKIG